jgi:ketosteroid isomerase-like protein
MRTFSGVVDWMDAFAQAVRSQDYAAGRKMFSGEVFSFGTYTDQLVGLSDLVENQWKPVWSITRNFHFHLETVRCEIIGDYAWAAASWQSEGQRSDGEWYPRFGRATLILQWQPEGWRAVHSHFSLQPDLPSRKAEHERSQAE